MIYSMCSLDPPNQIRGSHDNQSNLTNWRDLCEISPPEILSTPRCQKSTLLTQSLFHASQLERSLFTVSLPPLPQIPGPFLSKPWKATPPTNYPKHWDVKTFVVAIPIVYPQVEPILGELTQQGFDCFVCSSMENPLCPMRMFSLVFLRRGVKYPTLDCTPFQGTASFRPLKYTAAAVYRQYLGSIVWDLFTCCWYWVRLSVSRDADFMRRGAFLVPPPQTCPCCYIHIF